MIGNDWATFNTGLWKRPPKWFPYVKGFPCLSLFDLHSLVQCWSLLHLLHKPESWGLLFGLFLYDFSKNFLSTISFKVCWYIEIKTFCTLMSLQAFENYLFCLSLITIVKRLNTDFLLDPFIYGCSSDLKGPRIFYLPKLAFSKPKIQ